MSASSYVESLATLCASFLNQAIGRSTGAHGAFRDYQIDAVTLSMFASGNSESSSYQIDLFTRYGRLVEEVMRSVNNLLEKFHQSFFLYLLCSSSKFVSVGLYMIPLGLLLVTLPVGAAALNSALVKVDETGPGSDSHVSNLGATEGSVPEHAATKNVEESIGLLDIKTTKENAGRLRHAILVVSAVQLWAFVVALFPLVASSVVDMLETTLALTGITPVGGFNPASLKMSLWAVVKLGIAIIDLVVMSQVDFAVSMMGAVVLVPICLCSSPLRDMCRGFTTQGHQKEGSMLSRVSLFLGTMVTFLGSPPVLFAAAAVLLCNAHGQVSLERLWQWTELLWSGGSALYSTTLL